MSDPLDASMTVLHVDDEPEFGDLTATVLEDEDERFTVETATSASEGLERLTPAIDCVVSDYEMPGQNGIEFLESVREEYPDLPFILFTGKGSEAVASDAISAGVTDYLQKTSGTSQYTVLANRIENAVEQYRSRTALAASQEQLSLFIEQSPLGVIEWDENFEVVGLNPAAESILGYSEAELAGRSWEAIVPESDKADVATAVDELLEAEGGFHSINENVRADGERIICEWHNRVITDETGEAVAIFSQFQDVTDRRENERRLQEYREYTSRLLDASDDLFFVADETGALKRWNDSLTAVTGYSDAEIESMNVLEFIPEDHRERNLAAVDDVFETGHSHLETPILTADGSRIPYEFSADRVEHPDGNQRLVGIGRSLADRDDRERELRRLKKEYQSIFEHAQDSLFLVDVAQSDGTDTFRYQRINPAYEAALSVADEDVHGRTPVEVHGAEMGERIRDRYRQCVEAGETISYEEEVATDEGTRVFDTTLSPVRIDGEIAQIVGVSHEVTSRKEREATLEDRTARLQAEVERRKAAETRYQSLFENNPNVIWVEDFSAAKAHLDTLTERVDDVATYLDEHQEELEHLREQVEILDVNENAVDYYGADSKEELLTSLDQLFTERTVETSVELWARIAAGDTEYKTEVLSQTLDGELRNEIFKLHVPDAYADDYSRVYITGTDITERKEREEALKRQNERLDEFASVVSHDLRNPLNVAQTRLEFAQAESDSEHLDHVETALDRMETLIEDLLTLAREGEQPTDVASVDLASVVQNCWQTTETADATLATEDLAGQQVVADPGRLRQLFENLYRNAVEHGGDDVAITVGIVDDGTGFYVADDGPGIPDDEKDQVFRSGYSTATEGTGFGLTIVRAIARAHDWSVSATDSSAGGARFEVTGVDVSTDS
jgi:PAS domain S-box-containing protein